VLNVACGPGWYPRGQDRLRQTLFENNPDLPLLFWRDEYPPGCPSHKTVPYAFKPYAFKEAQRQGFRFVLWLDAAVWAIRNVTPVFMDIVRDGCYFQYGGYNSGQWCSDAALKPLGITREAAFKIPHMMACIMGLDLGNENVQTFLDQWFALANDGVTFPGAWTNKKGEVSKDTRVLGHRHDQTAASVLSHRMGMVWTRKSPRLRYKTKGMKPVPERTCFLSAGM
jgi:hypothetical protein